MARNKFDCLKNISAILLQVMIKGLTELLGSFTWTVPDASKTASKSFIEVSLPTIRTVLLRNSCRRVALMRGVTLASVDIVMDSYEVRRCSRQRREVKVVELVVAISTRFKYKYRFRAQIN